MTAAALIANAVQHAAGAPPDVRKAALLRIARVQTIVSPGQAKSTLEAGLQTDHRLPESRSQGFEQLTQLSIAAVAPERLTEFPPQPMHRSLHHQLVRTMIEHGHLDYLRTYVLFDAPLIDVPLRGIAELMRQTNDDEERRVLLSRALEAWRAKELNGTSFGLPEHDHLLSLLRSAWNSLPREEARYALNEMLDHVLAKPDTGVNGQINEATFTSIHALEIFQMFDLLMEADPARAQKLIKAQPELAEALKRYPKGPQTISEEAEAKRLAMPPPDPDHQGVFIMSASSENREYAIAMFQSEKTGDFSKPLEFAHADYREERSPAKRNYAPKAFWYSGAKYRTICYGAAKSIGEEAERYLTQISDEDLRLLAQIELAAGLCGLPELTTTTQRMPRRSR